LFNITPAQNSVAKQYNWWIRGRLLSWTNVYFC